MNYFYAGMGIAMITGIMAMIEIANSLVGQGLYSEPPKDLYLGSSAQTADKVFLKALTKASPSWPKNQEFCTNLKTEAINLGYANLASTYTVGSRSLSIHQRLRDSCTLTNENNHRIVISYKNLNDNSFGLYTCRTKFEPYCDFEK